VSYPTRHQLDHVVPTVIHDREEKMTALGRWTHHAWQEPRKYIGWPVAILVGIFVAIAVWKLATGGTSTTSDVWARLETAKTPAERVDLARDYPKSQAATWALLQAGTELYNQALADLPHNRDVALPTAKKALDAFDKVEHEAARESVQARAAALGKARTFELRNELAKAIEQYQLVIKDWPGTPEADDAKKYLEALQDPQAAAFYKELYAYSPTKLTLPGFGTETLPGLPGTGVSGPAAPSVPSTSLPPSSLPALPPDMADPRVREVRVEPKVSHAPTPATAGATPSQAAGPQKDLPHDVFSTPSSFRPATATVTGKEKSPG
jgi:hypothetical protein